jgi:hypothetical protein
VRLPALGIGGGTRHHHLDRASGIVIAMPFRPQRDNLVVKCNADAAAHANHHRLGVHGGDAVSSKCLTRSVVLAHVDPRASLAFLTEGSRTAFHKSDLRRHDTRIQQALYGQPEIICSS